MLISWCAKKQGGVSLLTMKAEFVAASEVARELLGIREMLCELKGEASSLRAKHIEVRVKFVCDFSRREIVLPHYVRLEQMLADLLTKALNAIKLENLRALMRVG
ncbi:unnamed protein product [Peronospora belbahrii]|uniref:Uncharacterized protein n=1 Tax=Peronospora belbahrii TaxID=622444 RepID=A0ABN8CR30_9STRA|nr:unnamed protein product [Peronospora belbahrii]